jgi:hypothetical protein
LFAVPFLFALFVWRHAKKQVWITAAAEFKTDQMATLDIMPRWSSVAFHAIGQRMCRSAQALFEPDTNATAAGGQLRP